MKYPKLRLKRTKTHKEKKNWTKPFLSEWPFSNLTLVHLCFHRASSGSLCGTDRSRQEPVSFFKCCENSPSAFTLARHVLSLKQEYGNISSDFSNVGSRGLLLTILRPEVDHLRVFFWQLPPENGNAVPFEQSRSGFWQQQSHVNKVIVQFLRTNPANYGKTHRFLAF